NPGTPDNSQMRRCVHQLRCNFCLTAHNQPTRIAYRFAQLVGWQPGALLEQESGVSERLKTTIANVIGNENLWFISRHEELETYLRVVRKEGGMVTVSKTCVESGIIARRTKERTMDIFVYREGGERVEEGYGPEQLPQLLKEASLVWVDMEAP